MYAKAPTDLLLCDDLSANSKLLWIVLANQANFRPIDKSVLDRRLGIHRSTRLRCMKELRELRLISGTEEHVIIHNPLPILRQLREEDNRSRKIAEEELLDPMYEIKEEVDIPTPADKAEKKRQARENLLEKAVDAWNKYRPDNYSKINKMSAQLLTAVDTQMKSLGLKTGDYDQFFSVLKAGIANNDFWANENRSKNLQSIVGMGSPTTQKFYNVQLLYDDGLRYDKPEPLEEKDRKNIKIVPFAMRTKIEDYERLNYQYFTLWKSNKEDPDILKDQIIDAEKELRDNGLEPALFRLPYPFTAWPTDVPVATEDQKALWKYDNEVNN